MSIYKWYQPPCHKGTFISMYIYSTKHGIGARGMFLAQRPPTAYRFLEQGAVDYYHAVDGYPYVRGIRTFKPVR